MKIFLVIVKLGFSLSVFMISLRLISCSLQAAIGYRLRRFLQMLTHTPPMSMLSGALATAAVQSSSMVAALMVALVDAGELSLKQAFGVILGANIGTTITAQIVAIDVSRLALPILVCGLFLLPWNRISSFVGVILIGSGGLFIGLELLKLSLWPLLAEPAVKQILLAINSQVVSGVIVGVVLTALVQSSSAVTGLVISLAQLNGISLLGAVSVALGSNIGTVTTTIIASIGMSKKAKATAYADLLFNIFGVLLVLPVIKIFTSAVSLTAETLPRQVANAHTLFNIVTAVFALPLINILTRITGKMAGITGDSKN